MDIFTLLAVVVALVTVLSAYLLFNGVPSVGQDRGAQRPTRRP